MRARFAALLILLAAVPVWTQPNLFPDLPLPKRPGGQIVFSRYVTGRIPNTTESIMLPKLFVMNADGSDVRPFFTPGEYVSAQEARWSPDFDQLVFSSDYMTERSACMQDIFAASADGTSLTRITGAEAPLGTAVGGVTGNVNLEGWPASGVNISAQGSEILYHPDQQGNFVIPVMSASDEAWIKVWRHRYAAGTATTQVLPNQVKQLDRQLIANGKNIQVFKPSISADGRWVAGLGTLMALRFGDPVAEVKKTGVDTVSLFDVTRRGQVVGIWERSPLTVGEGAKDPVVSPDGNSICVCWGRECIENLALVRTQDLINGRPNPTVLVPGQNLFPSAATAFQAVLLSAATPAFSPDGSMVAFSRVAMGTTFVTSDICVVSLNGGGVRQVTSLGVNHICVSPCFSPDGQSLAFTVLTGNAGPLRPEQLALLQFTADIFTTSLNGGAPARITNDGISSEPAWGP